MSSKVVIALPPQFLAARTSISDSSTSRKRRLDHLSWEEKLQRKKLKNRVAAQTSRDRKKAKMDDMEGRLDLLEKSNMKLLDEMKSLRELNERLADENKQLKKQVASANAVVGAVPYGSAVSRPLPKAGTAPTAVRADSPLVLYQLAVVFLFSMISSPENVSQKRLSLKKVSIPSNSLQTVFLERLIQKIANRIQQNPKAILRVDAVRQKWWGRHQSTWNPVEVKI